MNRPCSCWITPRLGLHDGHCCFRNGPGECHDDVLTAAAHATGPTRFYP